MVKKDYYYIADMLIVKHIQKKWLPLIAVNCAIMGGALFMQQRVGLPAAEGGINSLWQSIVYGLPCRCSPCEGR